MKRPHPRFLTPILFLLLIPCTAGFVFSEQEANPAPVEQAAADTSTLKMPAALAAAGFVKFAAAVQAAGLSATLEEDGPFTCFAPTDKAFDAMPEKIVKLLKESPKSEETQAWIKYHFVKGVALKHQDLQRIPGANGLADKYLRVWVTPGKISINRVCEVTRFDLIALNGIIHEVDRSLDAEDEWKVNQKKP